MRKAVFSTGSAVVLLAVLCSVATIPVVASEKVITISQAKEFAMQNNGELKALREERGAREAGKKKAGLFPNPVLAVEGATGVMTGSPDENNLSIGVSQEFITAGKRGKRLRVAEKEIEGFDRQIDNFGRLVEEEVKTTFYDLLLAEKRVELAERSIALSGQLLTVAQERFAAGDIPELEVNLAKVEVARSEGRKIEVDRDLYQARSRILALMGLPPDESPRFNGSLEAKPFAMNAEELRRLALDKRPDLKALEAEKGKGDAEMALAQAEGIPNVTAGIAFQREATSVTVAGNETISRDNLIGLKFSVPIPLFDRNQAGISEAQARKGSAENRYLFARRTIEREVDAACARLTAAEKSLTIFEKEIIPQLEENMQLVQEAYRLGELGILTVVEEQKKFFEVNDGYLTALYNRRTAHVKLESAVATDLTGGAQ